MMCEEDTAEAHYPPSSKLDVNVQNIKLIYLKERIKRPPFERNKKSVKKI